MSPDIQQPINTRDSSQRHIGLWVWPFLLALTFAAAVGFWLETSERNELEEDRRTLIADVLSLESRITEWLKFEEVSLTQLATALPSKIEDETLMRERAISDGLRRIWISITALDADNRLLGHIPQGATKSLRVLRNGNIEDDSLSTHIAAPLKNGGKLIVRLAPSTLLRQTVPWWLTRKYEVRLIDDYGQRIATTGENNAVAHGQSYSVSMEPIMPSTFLELSIREIRKPWWKTLPLYLLIVFVALSGAASWALRNKINAVANAEKSWRMEAAWRGAIENSLTIGLRGRDADGRLVHVNRAFCDLVGYSPEQLLGQLPPMPYWLPDAIEDSMQRHLRNMAGDAPREGYEAQWLRKDGKIIDIMMYEAPLVDSQGRHIGWMGSVLDITDRKLAQERERQQIETLGKQARLTTLGEIASALAHQLNQPLAALASYNAGILHTLERDGYSNTVVLNAVRHSIDQVNEAGYIVQRIRGFLTRRTPQLESSPIEKIVQRTLTMLYRDIQLRHVDVKTFRLDKLPPVWIDPVLIEQVLINLLRNAIEAVPDKFQPQIHIEATVASNQFVRIDVHDNGLGLQQKSINQLATPFHSSKPEGMGMGLSICRSIIEAHHGALEAMSSHTLGGAQFSFTLPIAQLQEYAV